MHRTITFLLVGFFLILALAGCNMPASAPIPTVAIDQSLTQAAMTIVVELTLEAPLTETAALLPPTETPLPDEPTVILISDTPEATQTPSETATAEDASTATPSPTITQTPTVTPLGEVIYEDDFSDDNWYTTEEDDWSFYYEDEEYHITNELLGATIWSVRGFTMRHVRVEVDGYRAEGPNDGFYGVMCRWSEEGENYYSFVVGDNGYYGIGMMLNNEFEWLEEGTDQSEIIKTGDGALNRVTGECIDEQLTLFVNGEEIADVLDDTHSNGDIGLVAGNKYSGVGMDAAFDNLVVIRP